jgi:hypothetical protein
MEVTVSVERLDKETYGAETAQPIALVTEGRTRDEAIERLRVLASQRLTAGEMVRLEIPKVAAPHPWVPFAGIWKDHPDLDAVLRHIAAERRWLDAAEPEVRVFGASGSIVNFRL